MFTRSLIILGLLTSFWTGQSIAQDSNIAETLINLVIPEVAQIDFHGSSKLITFNSTNNNRQSVEQVITSATDDKTWINYSSIVKPGSTNRISVQISDGELPPGAAIDLAISYEAMSGKGATGISCGQITLRSYPQDIITDIGSCYTGSGINKGHQLTYTWKTYGGRELNSLREMNYTIKVTYTIASED
ncbi:hypothetical protein ACFLSI_05480 [Bacteroidota bacterium]